MYLIQKHEIKINILTMHFSLEDEVRVRLENELILLDVCELDARLAVLAPANDRVGWLRVCGVTSDRVLCSNPVFR